MFKARFSWLETCLASFEVSDANALRYCSFMLHLHHIITIITNLLSKVTNNTFFGVFTLDFLLSKTQVDLSLALLTSVKTPNMLAGLEINITVTLQRDLSVTVRENGHRQSRFPPPFRLLKTTVYEMITNGSICSFL